MTRAFRRFAAMQPGELRFRLTCEARKGADRLRHVLAKSQWSRAALVGALDSHSRSKDWAEALSALRRRDHLAAHRSLARHFRTRSTPFPLGAARLHDLAGAIGRDFPGARADASTRADAVTRGRYDVLGFKGLELGPLPDWHRDGVSDRRSPLLFWSAVPYLDSLAGDHKVIWELNRHQHWLVLGRAHALTGDRRYYDLFTSQLASWLAANPPLLGTNWASMLELGFRSLSWLWSLAAVRRRRRRRPTVDTVARRSAARARSAADARRAQPLALLQSQHAPDRRGAGALCRRAGAARAARERAAHVGRPRRARAGGRPPNPAPTAATPSSRPTTIATRPTSICWRRSSPAMPPTRPPAIFEDAARRQARFLRTHRRRRRHPAADRRRRRRTVLSDLRTGCRRLPRYAGDSRRPARRAGARDRSGSRGDCTGCAASPPPMRCRARRAGRPRRCPRAATSCHGPHAATS